ncbi:hypothetical protein LSTR_LSTR005675 [Laodelphax striatellus]|uniref:Uncharacterized protein n=1 Tax=Laodelphax striatellus TaxID=195883 RepID=A0A482X881_LAOST|nr:hypothetical protein LSTR_LSTR005675 [Laodelphax striatellus]
MHESDKCTLSLTWFYHHGKRPAIYKFIRIFGGGGLGPLPLEIAPLEQYNIDVIDKTVIHSVINTSMLSGYESIILITCAWRDMASFLISLEKMDGLQETMGPLSTKHDTDPGSPVDKKNPGSVFYAIYIPEPNKADKNESVLITPYRSASRRLFSRKRKMHDHVVCLTNQILACLTEGGGVCRTVNEEDKEKGGVGGGGGGGGGQLPSTEEECAAAWMSAVPCQCNWTVTDSKRLSWRNRSFINNIDARKECHCSEGDSNSVPESNNGLSKTSSDDESDNSGAESGDFYTPPSSPGSQRLHVSDEELSMESPDEGPDIFIYSDGPTYLDNAVYEALERDKLDSRKYPFICRLVQFISLHSKETRERWGQPKRSPNGQNPYLNSPSSMNSSFDNYSPCRPSMAHNFRNRKCNNFPSKRLLF